MITDIKFAERIARQKANQLKTNIAIYVVEKKGVKIYGIAEATANPAGIVKIVAYAKNSGRKILSGDGRKQSGTPKKTAGKNKP